MGTCGAPSKKIYPLKQANWHGTMGRLAEELDGGKKLTKWLLIPDSDRGSKKGLAT